jgi:hypothetical protein
MSDFGHTYQDDPVPECDCQRCAIATRDALRAEVERLTSAKDGAYEERNRCVALIARMALSLGCRAGLARTAIEGWSEDWHGCVYIDLPTGQVSWHYHDSHGHLFEGLPKYAAPWDGHDTPEKYRRVGDAREFPRTAWVENQFRQINDWCCYATEEDIAARLMALQQIGVLARAALKPAEVLGPSKEWCARMAELEGDSEIGAGPMANVMPAEVTNED